MNYIEEARRRFPNARVIGDGRFACVAQNGALIYLATTEQQSHSIALGVDNPVLVDLKPKFVPEIRETDEDLYEERIRAKREGKQVLRFR